MNIVSQSLQDTQDAAEKFLSGLTLGKTATLVCLSGDLGSGKTTFTKAVAAALGVGENVTSPTFVIEKIYELPNQSANQPFTHLIHIDAYRIERSEELVHLGWEEIIANPGNLIMLEWPERVADIIPKDAIQLSFKFIDETRREIKLQD